MALSTHSIFRRGVSPIIAAAVHDGHDTRPTVAANLAVTDLEQLREEDPMTGEWTQIAETQIVGLRSRFEVDLNRPRDKAVYRTPEDAWGLQVWKAPLSQNIIDESLAVYDSFYSDMEKLFRPLIKQHQRVVVYDLHTYNCFRNGPDGDPANPELNPEVNVGTGTMDREFWAPVVDQFIAGLRAFDFDGRSLDVRENIRFQGGYFGQWMHEAFPRQVCTISIEFKKVFMDEWTGQQDVREVERIYNGLKSTLPGVRAALENM